VDILLRKWCQNNKHYFGRACPRYGGKTARIDMTWRNFSTVTLCIEIRTVYGLFISDKSVWRPMVNFDLLYRGEKKIFHNGYLAYFCRSATKFVRVRDLANRNLLPKFHERGSRDTYHAAICISPSWCTCKVVFRQLPMGNPCARIVLVLFLFTALPED